MKWVANIAVPYSEEKYRENGGKLHKFFQNDWKNREEGIHSVQNEIPGHLQILR